MPSPLKLVYREIFEAIGWKDRFGGRIEEARQVDERGGTNGDSTKSEGDIYCG